jgi:hypothetical protein
MKKSTLIRLAFSCFISASLLSSCKEDKDIVEAPPVPDQTSTQELDNIASATGAGWKFLNKSETQTANTKGFVNGVGTAYSGTGFITAGWQANDGAGVISVWAISPKVILQNGDKITFYTRSVNDYTDPANVYPDRLQLRLALADKDSVGPGTGVGLFKINLVDVNASYAATLPVAYPSAWTKFEATVSGLSKPTEGHYALRYFVEDGGSAGTNSNGIFLDKVQYTSVNH